MPQTRSKAVATYLFATGHSIIRTNIHGHFLHRHSRRLGRDIEWTGAIDTVVFLIIS